MLARLLMPPGVAEAAFPLLAARTLRGFVDGYIAVLLPAYLLALGLDQLDVGSLSTTTIAGSARDASGWRSRPLVVNPPLVAVHCLVNGNYWA